MLSLLFFALSLHAADIDCAKPENRDLETWKQCRSLKYLSLGSIDLTGSVTEDLSCYRCGFTRLIFRGGPYSIGLTESRLANARCADSNMNGIGMKGVKASGFRSRDCNFEGANFTTAVLQDARFVRGNFRGANFAGADLTGAEFVDADLRGADFSQALMSRARFRNVKTDSSTKTPEGFHWPR